MIRPARDDDFDAFTALVNELGVDDPPVPFDRWRTDFMPTTLVAEQAGRVVGYVDCYAMDSIAHVRNLVVAPAGRNHGLGALLMRAAADHARALGIESWMLNVKQDNAPAIHLYEKLGLRTVYASTVFRITWDATARLAAEPAIAEPVDDAYAIEEAFDLPRGRLAHLATRRSRIIRQLREGDARVGIAVFDPEFPGANVFRVARPTLAGTLLAALRPHANHDYLGLVIERDDELARLVENTGADVRFRLFHMTGPLPA